MLDLSIVIVNWNVRDLLRSCLKSIENSESDNLSVETIVVDCQSTDGSIAMIQHEFPWVRLIEAGGNVGFSTGNNLGIESSGGGFVLLLNPDTVLYVGALNTLVNYLETHADVGVVGPKLLNEDGTTQSSRRRFPTLASGIFESTWLEGLAPRKVLSRYYYQDVDDSEITEVDWVTGAALVVRREVIDKVGVFDPGFFMYSEEVDWQRRIKSAGWRITYLPQAQVVHSFSNKQDSLFQKASWRGRRSNRAPGNPVKLCLAAWG
jgi:GT2 family glycosyltransferase